MTTLTAFGAVAAGLSSAASTAMDLASYNRDGYSDNMQMRQTQMYQEKNYYITWIAAVREEVRDIMTIFVGRMSNYTVVSVLAIGIVAGAICEGEPTETCPDFVVHQFYLSMYTAGTYLFMGVLYAVRGITVSYRSGMEFLVAVVPDAVDTYDHDYMHQVTKHFESDLTGVFRIPVLGSRCERSWGLLEDSWFGGLLGLGKGAKGPRRREARDALKNLAVPGSTVGKPRAGDSDDLDPTMENLPRGSTEPMAETLQRARSYLSSASGRAADWTSHASHQPVLGTVQESSSPLPPCTCGDGVGVARGEGCMLHSYSQYFDHLRRYSELWEPFARATEMSIAHGVLCLIDGSIYYCLGRLYDRSERWAALTILGMFVILAAVLFGDRHVSGALSPDSGRSHTRCWEAFVLLLIVAGPTTSAIADRAALPWMDLVFVPMSYMFHVCRALTFSISEFHCECRGAWSNISKKGAKYLTVEGHHHEDLERGGASRGGRASREDNNSEAATASTSTAASSSDNRGSPGEYQQRRMLSNGVRARQDPEEVIRRKTDECEEYIRTNSKMVDHSAGYVHGIVSLVWTSIFVWSLVIFVGQSDAMKPLAQVEELHVRWPSLHFRPTSMACAQGHVFVANRFGVYELADGAWRPVNCNLTDPIVDVTTSCDADRCSPVVLTGGSAATVAHCSSGTVRPLMQAPGPAKHLASLGPGSAGDLAALHGRQLVHYDWVVERRVYQPLWPLANVRLDGLRAVDVAEDASGNRRFFAFRAAAGSTGGDAGAPDGAAPQGHRGPSRRPEATVEVEVIDEGGGKAVGPHSYTLRLPFQMPPLRGGCVVDDQSLLVLMQGEVGLPVLGKLRLNVSTGVLL